MSKKRSKKGTKKSAPVDPGIWTISNMISVLRLLLAIPIVLLMNDPYGNRWLLLIIGLLAYVSDLADGYLARRLGQESDTGRIIDPLADKVFVAAAVLMLLLQGLIPLWFVLIVLARDMLIFSGGMYLHKKTGYVAESNLLGKAAVVSVGLVIVLSLFRHAMNSTMYSMGLVLSLGLLGASLYSYGERFISRNRKRSK